MPLSPEFEEFYQSWLQKADEYSSNEIKECFDKFFTLFVIYNQLYAEATFVLARKNLINISSRTSFPDSTAAKTYVLQYVKSNFLIQNLENDNDVLSAIQTIKNLISHERFHIKLDMVTGNGQREKDLELLKSLNSNSKNKRAQAILDFLYSIRCNMFHAHKGFHRVQLDLLRPSIVILGKIIALLHNKLSQDHS